MKSLKADKELPQYPEYVQFKSIPSWGRTQAGTGDFVYDISSYIKTDDIVLAHIGIYCYSDSGINSSGTGTIRTDLKTIRTTDVNVIGNRCGDASIDLFIPMKQKKFTYTVSNVGQYYFCLYLKGYMPINYKEK